MSKLQSYAHQHQVSTKLNRLDKINSPLHSIDTVKRQEVQEKPCLFIQDTAEVRFVVF